MGFFDRLSRLVRANANAAVSGMEDPAKILDQSVSDMQADLVKLRQAVALAIASQKRLNNQAEQAREGLNRQNHVIKDLLGQFRESNKLWKDIVHLVIFLQLVFANVKVLQ